MAILNVKVLMALVGAFDGACFIFIYFWTGSHALEVTMILCSGLGFTAGIFESGIPSKYMIDLENQRPRACFYRRRCDNLYG